VHWTGSNEVTEAFGDFVEHLLSSHTIYVRQVCDAVAQFLLPGMGVDSWPSSLLTMTMSVYPCRLS
jgi:hypothetical protein